MWIFDKNNSEGLELSDAVVTSTANGLTAEGDDCHFDFKILSPFGIEYIPELGTNVKLLKNGNDALCLGTPLKPSGMGRGEIMLYNNSGAYILLKNNGEVEINGLRISSQGKII